MAVTALLLSFVSLVPVNASMPPHEILNGDFETGNFDNWSVTGDAFSVILSGPGSIFNQHGNYHVWGAKNGDDKTGTLSTHYFYVFGKYVDFLVGGGNDINNLYVALVDEYGREVYKTTGTGSESYRRVIWDVSAYQYKSLTLKVVDNATGSWGHINIDDVHGPWESIVSSSYGELPNHDFETGDLSWWTAYGAFTTGDVASDTTFWGGPFNQNGTYHLWSFKDGGDGQTGVLWSSTFTLGGFGQIDFLVSGGNDINNLYVELVRASDNKVLFRTTGTDTEQYSRVSWDASVYLGEQLYIRASDYSTGGFGHINIDDVNVQVKL